MWKAGSGNQETRLFHPGCEEELGAVWMEMLGKRSREEGKSVGVKCTLSPSSLQDQVAQLRICTCPPLPT